MKIIKVLIGIRDFRSYNPLTFSPMKIGDYSSRISLRHLSEGGDRFNGQSIHLHCMFGSLYDWIND